MDENDLKKLLTMDIVDEADIQEDELEEDFEALKNGNIKDASVDIESEQNETFHLEDEVEIDTSLPHEQGDLLIALETNTKEELAILMNDYKNNAIQQKKLGKTDLAVSYMKGYKMIQEKINELEPLKLPSEIRAAPKSAATSKPPLSAQIVVEKSEPIVDKNMIKQLHHQLELSSLYAKIFLRLQDQTSAIYFHRLSKFSQNTLDHYPTKLNSTKVEWSEPAYNPFVTPNTIQIEISNVDGIAVSAEDKDCEIFILVDMGAPVDKPIYFTHEAVVKANACSKKFPISPNLEINEKFHFLFSSRIRKPINITICKSYPLRIWEYITGQRVEKIGKLTLEVNQLLGNGADAIFEWSNLLQIMNGRKPTDMHMKLALRTRKLLNSPEKSKKSETWYFEDTEGHGSPVPTSIPVKPISKPLEPPTALQEPIKPNEVLVVSAKAHEVKTEAAVISSPKPASLPSGRPQTPKSESPQAASPVGGAETDPLQILFNPEYMTSNLVFEYYLEQWAADKTKEDEIQEIQLKVNLLGIKVSTGQLTMQQYQQLLNARYEVLKRVAIALKNENNLLLAQQAMIQIKKIQQEIKEISEMMGQ